MNKKKSWEVVSHYGPLLIIQAVILLCAGFILSSDRPAPGEPESGHSYQDEAALHKKYSSPEQRGTEAAPLVVRFEKSEEDRRSAKNEERRAESNSRLQSYQTYFNFGLVVVGAAQIFMIALQLRVMNGQREAQEKELRGYGSFSINLNPDKDPVAGKNYILIFNCTNRGKTPIFNIGFRGGIWCLARPFKISDTPKVAEGFDEDRTNLFAEEGMHERNLGFEADTETKFSAEEIQAVKEGKNIFIIGLKIRYMDVFNEWHETEEFWSIRYEAKGRIVSLVAGKSRIT